ncbi:Acyl-CoA hydrolase [Luteibacter sp. UNCMF331Sha3.1]|uniref:acetyl-CoA hydrolase/transferase C-terminal domain-containing protein n=1 Tax=Luteibacter sp. UNCMF331Sha3.1 TaxID=1502760 RepID=UPI0008CB1F4F|nr:acetyl-CoA hydrolase/transferase C-terminal domain-containing protein [Luteibacter sp. UNCMF331Sha3.1]SEN37501.1 Acyl-CoA hydrolase [Luteibacter sp. UNCMF331Sha3.1]
MASTPRDPATDAAVEAILQRTGGHPRVAAPLGLGKPHGLLNALYRAVEGRADRSLTLFTALSLTRPSPGKGLAARFAGPFIERHFGAGYEDLLHAVAQGRDALPPNIRVHEFYMQSGALLHSAAAQRDYISQNYTHVARDLASRDVDVLVQLVAVRDGRISLSSNPDLTFDFLDRQAEAGRPKPFCVAVAHPDMPYVSGHAEAPDGMFDLVVEPATSPPLFAMPRGPIAPAEFALGMHASALVVDGGTLQIGIGALSDALVRALLLRHEQNDAWGEGLEALDREGVTRASAAAWGGVSSFDAGLYGASEMVMDGFMHLQRAGVLRRRAYDDLARERAAAAGNDQGTVGGHYLRGAFLLGSRELYAWMDRSERDDPDAIDMCRVSNVNHLYGDHQPLAALQRRGARFFNTCMMATLTGAAVSDGLDDGRVVSGVGGQFNFVAMAHELPGGRSILLLRATRGKGRHLASNIRFAYGHTTIPRHLRDVFVTEYGVADLRGLSDEACIEAMLGIADARFVDALAAEAKRAGKLRQGFVVPEAWRAHTPEGLTASLAPMRARGLLDPFPFGSDFTPVERRLLPALGWLKDAGKGVLLAAMLVPGRAVEGEDAALKRMGLARVGTLKAWMERRALLAALRRGVG